MRFKESFMRRPLLYVSLSLLVVMAVGCSEDSEYQVQRQAMVDALHRDIADEDLGGLDFAEESRCIAEGVVSAFNDSRFVELGLDTAAASASLDDVLDNTELTAGERSEILEVMSSCVEWEAFAIAALTEGVIEEGVPEESAQCLVDGVSEESIGAFVDAILAAISADILREQSSSEDDLLAEVGFSISAEMVGAMPRCMRLGEPEDSG
ncbi:MAG: hypothetical protein OXH67_13735 [Acidimicrobiaceae bacterium]|nr:hypothetical protein [Acidimicrobiaceae bacterium]